MQKKDPERRFDDSIIRRPRLRETRPFVFKIPSRRKPTAFFSSPLILLYGFISLILLGGILLSFPIASVADGGTPFVNAFFTSTSAVTVTGLTVVSTAEHWSIFGQVIIFILMLVGGLGFMSFATFILVMIGQRISLQESMLISDTISSNRIGGMVSLLRNIVVVVMSIYLIGMIFIFWRIGDMFPVTEALWQSIFLSVSSFNNAGFTILPDSRSIEGLKDFKIIFPMISFLIILGSIGWVTLVDVYRKRRFSRFSLDTKLVLTTTIFLFLIGLVVFFVGEYSNGDTIKYKTISEKLGYSVIHSITGRTAGFTSVNFADTSDLTKLFFTMLMFIGGAAGSTTGGIKVVTFAVIVAAVVSSIKNRTQTEAFGREIPAFQVHRALTVTMLSGGLIFFGAMLLTITERDLEVAFLDMFFDIVSAFATTGLSTGVAPLLSAWGKIMFIIVMVLGRLGPLALALALTPQEEVSAYRFAQERVRIG